MKRVIFVLAVSIVGAVLAPPATAAPSTPATFEGRTIDLNDADGWGAARACTVGITTVCFRTEEQLVQYLTRKTVETAESVLSLAVGACSTPARLYANANRTGNVLTISARLKWVDLAAYGFDNVTSSYKIGSCAATLADSKAGAGARLSAGAGAQVSSMPSGWNDRASSIYLN